MAKRGANTPLDLHEIKAICEHYAVLPSVLGISKLTGRSRLTIQKYLDQHPEMVEQARAQKSAILLDGTDAAAYAFLCRLTRDADTMEAEEALRLSIVVKNLIEKRIVLAESGAGPYGTRKPGAGEIGPQGARERLVMGVRQIAQDDPELAARLREELAEK